MFNLKEFLGCVVLHGLLLIISFTTDCTGINPYNLVKECPPPVFNYGKVRTRQRGRLAKYQCRWGYEMVGQRYTSCISGSWDSPPPICIRPGCPRTYPPENGVRMYTRQNAVVMYFCNPGYALVGGGFAYCNGMNWNATAPKCERNASTVPAKSCDFEKADLCGWTHDPYHDFDWRRQNRKTPSGHVGTGPSFDHTLGVGNDGYYMYIESTARLENDTARLVSPVYPAALSRSGCFLFAYHMYGRTIGALRVLVVPVSIQLSTIVSDPALRARYTMFQEAGNQGDEWYNGFFDLDVSQDNFQIVIEGVRGSGYVSDIAVDDVALLEAEQCAQKRVEHAAPSAIPNTTKDSCINRCDQLINTTASGEAVDCTCVEDCVFTGSCCVDYRDICVFSLTDSPGDTLDMSTQESSTEDASSVPPPLPPSLKMTATNSPDNSDARKESWHTTESVKGTVHALTSKPSTVTASTAKPTTIKPATIKQATTTQKQTTNVPFTTIASTSTTPKLVKTMKPIVYLPMIIKVKTTQRVPSIPILQFATPSPPITNATGILNRPSKVDLPTKIFKNMTVARGQNDGATKNYTVNLDRYVPEVFNVTKKPTESAPIPTTKAVSKAQTVVYSKTFEHYSVLPPGYTTDASPGSRNAAMKMNLTAMVIEMDKIFDKEDDAVKSKYSSWGLIVAMTLLAVGCSAGAIYLVRSGRFRTLVERGRMRMRLDSSSSNSDMRFLVQDEELEHDYED